MPEKKMIILGADQGVATDNIKTIKASMEAQLPIAHYWIKESFSRLNLKTPRGQACQRLLKKNHALNSAPDFLIQEWRVA